MGFCKDCRFWDDEPYDPGKSGMCRAVDEPGHKFSLTDPASLCTEAEFGCTEFHPKEMIKNG